MLNPANRASFTLEIAGLEHDFRVLAFTAKESISRPFSVRIELVSERANLKLEDVLHRLAFLRFDADGNGLHGQIGEIAQGDSGKRFTHYFIHLVPSLKRLEYRSNHRIFQGKTVPEIIALVLKDHAIFSNGFAFRLREPCKPRDYCTQYQETDLHFVRRLCEEEGIHFHFQHSPDEHLLVFADDPIQLPVLKAAVAYVQSSGQVGDASVINRFNVRLATRSGKASHQTYHFQLPQVDLLSSAGGDGRKELEDYQYPAAFTDLSVGTRQAQKALERNRSDVRLASGSSDQSALVSGHLFELTHPNPEWSQQWLLTSVFHEGKQPQVLEESMPRTSGAFTQGYRNRFEAIPGEVPFRPPLRHRKPRVLGSQHAVVTGPSGEEIYCDEYGRIKVKFFWDREGKRNEHSSCWLRVATGWAHEQYGSVMIPRVGMEVIVGYFEADPDQPYVQACLPNAGTRAPLNLPMQNTQTVLKTQSSPGGAGFNELRIEDRKGAESISIRAQRNWSEHVLNDQSIQVDNQRKVNVTGLSSHELHGEEHHLTHGARKTQVLADDSLTVVGNQHISAANHLVSAATQVHLHSKVDVVINAGLNATIKAGVHWISISPAGIFSSVPIQLGGVPVSGMPAVPGLPAALIPQVALPANPSLIPDVQLNAIERGVSFCQACADARKELS
ncbi:type VI secretion system tip protein TssI/VgrG [Pseudomonas quasicaspiana]|uniref:type VI secretion system tip protein TssI/VgrG n=1 Tax=Pseudomonas quasicaspiana TaxID=2829821 RepID=UPI001E3D69B6|nr:type VI secretion system tip protein TssI/VgrG [Pseudomonas quasicaspiana]MCD5978295.1 type VI secretion system tip protein VgrG [Pseudomonas quasicaspiana]